MSSSYKLSAAELRQLQDAVEDKKTENQCALFAKADTRSSPITTSLRLRLFTEALDPAAHWLGSLHYKTNSERQQGKLSATNVPHKNCEDEAYEFAKYARQRLLNNAKAKLEQSCVAARKAQVNLSFSDLVGYVDQF